MVATEAMLRCWSGGTMFSAKKQIPNEDAQTHGLFFDAFRETELDEGSQKILFGKCHLEIDVSLQVICEKPQTQLQG